MPQRDEIRDFLVSRRARLSPDQVDIPTYSSDRRVPGLRREEVADLAGVSLDYYTRIERGSLRGVSDGVLTAIARALRLDDVETAYLLGLARPVRDRTRAAADEVRPSVQRVLDAVALPTIVVNGAQDIVGSNALGAALFSQALEDDRPNLARFAFLDSRAPEFYVDWPLACSLIAAMLRFEAGRDPLNEELTELIGELAMRSHTFRRHWADRDVHEHRSGTKVYRHPEVGELEVSYDVFEMAGEPGLSMSTFAVVEGSVSASRLAQLAAWAAGDGGSDPAPEGQRRPEQSA